MDTTRKWCQHEDSWLADKELKHDRGLFAAVVAVVLAVAGMTVPVSVAGSAAAVPDVNGVAAGNAAIRSATTITVPGGGWYEQGFTDVSEATYSRTVAVPESGQPQSGVDRVRCGEPPGRPRTPRRTSTSPPSPRPARRRRSA